MPYPYTAMFINKFIFPNDLAVKILNLGLSICIAISIYYSLINKDQFTIDKNVVNDLKITEPFLIKNSTLSFCANIDGQWELKASLYRKYHISVTEYQEKDTMFVSQGCISSLKDYKLIARGEKYSLIVKR